MCPADSHLLLCGEEGRACSAEQADLTELREYDSYIQVEQAEGTDDNEGGVEEKPNDAIAGGLWLIILIAWCSHCCIHGSCITHRPGQSTDPQNTEHVLLLPDLYFIPTFCHCCKHGSCIRYSLHPYGAGLMRAGSSGQLTMLTTTLKCCRVPCRYGSCSQHDPCCLMQYKSCFVYRVFQSFCKWHVCLILEHKHCFSCRLQL